MADTSFNVAPEKQARLVTIHQRQDNGELKEMPPRPLQPAKSFDGGGGIYSTAGDYVIFMRMLLNGGQLGKIRILRPETVALMGKNQIGDLTLQEFKGTNPKVSLSGSAPGGLDKFGLGFALNSQAVQGGRGAWSMSWAGVDNTYFWIDPANKTAAVIMMQVLPFLDSGPIDTLKNFEHALYASRPSAR
jgi:methyl acetate hydrolase